uniref:G_PROTEIN_RECEP_F1_2 domain-containing protein n=1 Tax=Rhabditophanes sp. KR3021 TaxID=114890 RepID=A0AC35TXU1_9BILA
MSSILFNNKFTNVADDNDAVFNTLKSIALFLLVLWTIVANSLVFIVLYKNPRLQTVPNLLVGNLAFSDLCLSLIVLPLSSVYAIAGKWIFPEMLCVIFVSADILCCTASIWNLSIVGLDRYWAITSPVEYMQKRNKTTAFYMIVCVWIFSAVISLAPLLGWKQMASHGNFRVENGSTICDFLDLPSYTIYSATGSFFIPTLVMFFVYFKIYRAFAKHRARQIYRQKVIRKHIESTILHEISHVLPTSDEFAKEEEEDENSSTSSQEDNNKRNCTNMHINNVIIEEDEAAINEEEDIVINEEEGEEDEGCKLHDIENSQEQMESMRAEASAVSTDVISSGNNFNDISNETKSSQLTSTSNDKSFGPQSTPVPFAILRRFNLQKNNDAAVKMHNNMEGEFVKGRKLNRVPSGPRKKKSISEKSVAFRKDSFEGKRRNSTELASAVYEKINKKHIRREKGISGLRNSLRNKPKAISAAKERRGVKVLGIILGCFTICWTPFFIMYVLVQFCDSCTMNPHIEMFITWLGYSNSAMNPIIYTVTLQS